MQRYYLFTDVEADDEPANVLVHTTLPVDVIQSALDAKGMVYDDCYEVQGCELSFYIYELLTLSEEDDAIALRNYERRQKSEASNAAV